MKPASRRTLALAIVVAVFGCAIATSGCRDQHEARSEGLPNGVVNEALYAFLSKARSAQHEADLAEASGDRKAAIAAMAQITKGARPAMSPEVEEVLADAYARAAGLLAQEGDFDGGMAEIDAGLALAKAPTHFRGHLFEIRGVVEEARSKDLRAKGDGPGADAAKERAIEAFQKAIEIQEKVIERALDDVDAASAGSAGLAPALSAGPSASPSAGSPPSP